MSNYYTLGTILKVLKIFIIIITNPTFSTYHTSLAHLGEKWLEFRCQRSTSQLQKDLKYRGKCPNRNLDAIWTYKDQETEWRSRWLSRTTH